MISFVRIALILEEFFSSLDFCRISAAFIISIIHLIFVSNFIPSCSIRIILKYSSTETQVICVGAKFVAISLV